jgi:large subunit ribosomal protein L23
MGIFNFKKEDEKKEVKAAAPKTAGVKAEPKKESAKKTEVIDSADKKGREIFGILLRPIVTERTSSLNALNQHVFEVAASANKITIAKAVFSRYGIKPVRVNVCNYPGQSVRYGRNTGRTKGWKKAIITLPEGKTINIYEAPVKS